MNFTSISMYIPWADPEIFKRRGRTSKSKKVKSKGVYDTCLGGGGHDVFFMRSTFLRFLYKEILSDHYPFAKYEVGVWGSSPRKILISMKQNRAIFRKFRTKH